jgi:hypothetical protein
VPGPFGDHALVISMRYSLLNFIALLTPTRWQRWDVVPREKLSRSGEQVTTTRGHQAARRDWRVGSALIETGENSHRRRLSSIGAPLRRQANSRIEPTTRGRDRRLSTDDLKLRRGRDGARSNHATEPEMETPTGETVGGSNKRSCWLVSGSNEMQYRESILAPSLAQESTAAKLTISARGLMATPSAGGCRHG